MGRDERLARGERGSVAQLRNQDPGDRSLGGRHRAGAIRSPRHRRPGGRPSSGPVRRASLRARSRRSRGGGSQQPAALQCLRRGRPVIESTVTANASELAPEWRRLELLGQSLALERQGEPVPDALIDDLKKAQHRVIGARDEHRTWSALNTTLLTTLELDVLACAVGPEAEPRLGWLFQTLQPTRPHPYPTLALIQELFALEARQIDELYGALGDTGALRRHRLVNVNAPGPYETIRPCEGVTSRLLGRADQPLAPPGANPVTLRVEWDQLILPEACLEALSEFLLWITHRETVFTHWGAQPTGGPVALFSGPSGTGKTFAASAIATRLGWPLYRVDLGRLVSKWLGETEENINTLFDAAHGRPMVLQFEEADSLFGKRGDVKEARDRYANLEISHLLARIETHEGPCILTTNLRRNLDPAFGRRFQLALEFPRPDATARGRLWRALLPPRAPLQGVDPDFLGRTVNLTGGEIRNAATHAAFLAAGRDGAIGLPEIALAVWRELGKRGKPVSPSDLGGLACHRSGVTS
ncbi:MAG: ATP-binding protein [Planctomycetes bacterium]|nr:ATP-binding protein [Planctomycetota bacterium]